MSETEQTLDTAAPAAAPAAAPSTAEAAPAAPASKGPARSPAEAAVARAQARFAKPDSPPDQGTADAAAAADTADGASAAAASPGETSDDQSQATGGQGGAEGTATADSIAAPEDWPAEQVQAFDRLPTDEAKQLMLDQYKSMQAGFTQKLQDIATIKQQHGALVDAMQQHGQNADSLIELMGTAQAFAANPKDTLAKLAAQAGVEVFFERPLPDGQIPEFETQAEMVAWLQKQSQEQARKLLAEETAKREAESRRTAAREAIQRQFSEAQTQHKDFESHRPAVVDTLAAIAEQGPTVEQAYRLATYDGLRKLAVDGQKAITELAQLKQQQEQAAKKATTAPNDASRRGKEQPAADDSLSPGQKALARAKARMSAALNGHRAA